jgi:hypothetical protein
MSTKVMQYTYPVPLTAVIPAAAAAARAVNKAVKEQTASTLVARGSWWRLIGYPVTIKVAVWGVDGAANVSITASSFGLGPIVSGSVQSEADEFVRQLTQILQSWAAQAPAQPPTA